MTTNNGWPGKPGVPMHPERDGWHWLEDTVDGVGTGHIEVVYYAAWSVPIWYRAGNRSPITKPKQWRYLGPVLAPDEVQNLRDDLASAERERAYQHGRADRNAAEYAREQARREALQARCEEAERTALQAAECHARETRRADALQKRVAELEAQNDTLRHATNKLRAMLTELNARHKPLQRAFITAVELLNDAALEGKKDE